MEVAAVLVALVPSWSSVVNLVTYFAYVAIAGSLLPCKVVPGSVLPDGTRLHYRCNGLVSLFLLMALLGTGISMSLISPIVSIFNL